jgi:hypothetical protein
MANEPYVSAKFKLSATFTRSPDPGGSGGDTFVAQFDDIVSMSASFALNTIPTASLIVAVGNRVNGTGGITKATIHDAKSKLQMRDKVKVTLDIIPGAKLQSGSYTVFEGYYAGIGYQRSHNNANYVLNLVHWLDDLNNSSAINGNWFPGAPFDYAQQALYDGSVNDRVNAFGPAPAIGVRRANVANLTRDLWGDVIKPIFEELGKFGGGATQSRLPPGADPRDRNDAAEAAFEKIPGASPNYVPLSLALDSADNQNIASSIASYFDKTIGESFVQNSIWAKLVGEYAADFLFAISPAVSWAVPIPFCGGLRWTAGDKVIRASEYSYASFNANMSQIIESVNVYYPLVSETNLANGSGPPNRKISYYRPCAEWPDKNAQNKRGLKLFKEPPRWGTEIGSSGLNAGNSSGNARLTVAPDGGGTALAPGLRDTASAVLGVRPIMQRFAKHWYMSEILKQRYGELSGPLRFDIAPGSIVKIEMPIRDRRQEANPTDFLYASVMSVSFAINAERGNAGTSFAIAHTKTEEEMSSASQYATDTPPMYANKWSSGPLAVPNGG